ncbi:hypothetical protein Tco_0332588, partial [Tanacetum coccineum]
EKDLVVTALKNELRKLKRKDLADNVVTKCRIAPQMLKIDVEPIALRLLNNRIAHSDYLRHTQEQAAIFRTDWDLLFQPLFDELLNPPPSVDRPAPEVIAPIAEVVAPERATSTGSPSSTTVDEDAPSPSNSQTTPKTQSHVISNNVKEENHDLDVAHMNNDQFIGILIPENVSEASFSSDVIPIAVHTVAPNSEHVTKWTKDHPLDNIIGLRISQSPKGIFINQFKYALESLKKYGMESSDPVDTPIVEKSKLDEDTQGKAVDPTHYRGMVGTLMYLTASRSNLTFVVCMCARHQAKPTEKHLHAIKIIFKYLRGTVNKGLCTSGCMQLLGDRLVSWSSKRQKSVAISSTEAEYIALSGYYAQVLWMRSQLIDYGLGFNKIPMYCDNKSAIALCCNNVQHSRSKHINIRFYFIKEQVENRVVDLYFVNPEYQLANIFTKALGRERIEFLINKLGMRSFTSETLKQLAYEAEEYQNRRDLPRDFPLDRVVVLRYEKRSKSENKGKVPTEMELVLEQTQQVTVYEVLEHQSDTQVITMKMEILLEPTSNKLMVERFDTSARNLMKEILLKLNLPDHRSILTDSKMEVKIHDKKGAKNLAADHLSQLESPNLGKLTKAKIRDLFLEERLMAISNKNNEPCVLTESYEGAWPEMRWHKFFNNVTSDHLEDIMASPLLQERSSKPDSISHIYSVMHISWSKFAMHVNEQETSPQGMKHLKNTSKSAKYSMSRE